MGDRVAAAGLQFRVLPNVRRRGRLLGMKQAARASNAADDAEYEADRDAAQQPTGFVCAFFATVTGFALIWHIWWMVIARLSAPSRPSWCSPGATMTNTRFRPTKSRASIAPIANARDMRAARAAPMSADRRSRPHAAIPPGARTALEGRARRGGPPPKRIVVGYGFWIFLLSDIIMFSAFFAAYAVLSGQTAGGPDGAELFDLKNVAIETGCLLLSSFTCGMASIAADARNKLWFQVAMAVTCVLGAWLPRRSSCTSSPIWSRAAPGRRAAPSCRRSSRWSAATACTSRPACCGC
jgi:cytochrome o ubiquinol oxidase subunit 1